MERRPKPVKAAAEAETRPAPDAAAHTSAQSATGSEPETVTEPHVQAAGEIATGGEQVDQEPASLRENAGETPALPGEDLTDGSAAAATTAVDQGASAAAMPAADEVAAAAESAPDAPIASTSGATANAGLPQADGASAEPELIDVWRPGGRSEERRGPRRSPQWQRPRLGHDQAAAANATEERPVATADGAEAIVEAGTPVEKKAPRHRGPRGPQDEFRRERDDGGERRQRDHRAEHRSERRGDRPERVRGEQPHFAKARTEHKDRRDYAPLREREKQVDPNSPFAKLAALKAQLEANAKERR